MFSQLFRNYTVETVGYPMSLFVEIWRMHPAPGRDQASIHCTVAFPRSSWVSSLGMSSDSKEVQDSLQVISCLHLIGSIPMATVITRLRLRNLHFTKNELNVSFINGTWESGKIITHDPRWRTSLLNSNLSCEQQASGHYLTTLLSWLRLKEVQ